MCSLPFSCWKKVFVKKKYWDPADDIESIKLKSVIPVSYTHLDVYKRQ